MESTAVDQTNEVRVPESQFRYEPLYVELERRAKEASIPGW